MSSYSRKLTHATYVLAAVTFLLVVLTTIGLFIPTPLNVQVEINPSVEAINEPKQDDETARDAGTSLYNRVTL